MPLDFLSLYCYLTTTLLPDFYQIATRFLPYCYQISIRFIGLLPGFYQIYRQFSVSMISPILSNFIFYLFYDFYSSNRSWRYSNGIFHHEHHMVTMRFLLVIWVETSFTMSITWWPWEISWWDIWGYISVICINIYSFSYIST